MLILQPILIIQSYQFDQSGLIMTAVQNTKPLSYKTVENIQSKDKDNSNGAENQV
ncbi:MAG: hypothetical protein OFPI_19300 [Osedax symbiont Rs2]|nr:MAG: hypothetical protein OFPI_19300 [Osedax symbiont Rs2]